jgi:hypothetical protein
VLKPGRWRWKSQDWKEAHGEFASEHQPAPRPRQLVPRMCGPSRVVVALAALDDDLGLAESVEDFAVEQLIAQASVGALDV